MPEREEIVPDKFRDEVEKDMSVASPEDYETWSVRRRNALGLFGKVFPSYQDTYMKSQALIEEETINFAIRQIEITRIGHKFSVHENDDARTRKLREKQAWVTENFGDHLRKVYAG